MKHDFEEVEQLRAALQYSSGNSFLDDLARGSLLSGVIGDDEELQDVYVQEVGPSQAVLDLHLEGAGVSGHSTNALLFSKFVAGIAETVKETVKAAVNKQRMGSDLLIEAVSPGSVRLVLRAPDLDEVPAELKRDQSSTERPVSPSSLQSDALRKVSRLLNLASVGDELENSALEASISTLPKPARTKLNNAMKYALSASWEIQGKIEQRTFGVERVELPKSGAARLRSALSTGDTSKEIVTISGYLDGFKYSTGTVWFEPESHSRFSAAVSDDELLDRVADLMSESHELVSAQFEVTTVLDPNKSSELRKSRSLLSVDRARPADTLF